MVSLPFLARTARWLSVDLARTGIPAAVMMERCVEEKTRWPPSLAAANRRATSAGRLSERPSCMVVEVQKHWGSTRGEGDDEGGGTMERRHCTNYNQGHQELLKNTVVIEGGNWKYKVFMWS